MKLLVALCIFAFVAHVSATSAPQVVYDGPTYELKRIDEPDTAVKPQIPENYDSLNNSTDFSRPYRVTCDVLSWQSQWFSFNHSACAVKCLAQGRKGGRCENGICVCR